MIETPIEPEEGAAFGSFLSHIPTMLWERRWWIIVPILAGVLAASAAILLISPRYQSSALMLVQSPQLPGEILADGNTEVVDRRMARIHQQITSRPDLVALIQKHNLYQAERTSEPLSQVVERMRDSITLTPTTVNSPGGQVKDRTIAFELAFQYPDPVLAQAVTQDLMDKILQLDASGNVEQVTNTEQFLSDQARGLEEKIQQIQGQISAVKARYGGVLGRGGLAVLGGNSGSYDVQIAALQRDNANLISQKQVAQESDKRDPVVLSAEAALAAARASYSESHPDVVLAKQRLEQAKELAKSNNAKLPLETLDQQIAFNNSQITQLRAAKAQEEAQTRAQISAQSEAPVVQQQVDDLQQSLQGLNEQYQSVQTRLMAARAGVKAEDEQLSERLSVVEPPIVPEQPVWPNRLLIAALGVGGGLALGLLLALGVEVVLRPIRDPDTLAAITGARPLGLVPIVEAPSRRKFRFARFAPRLAHR
jgi:uncharacterized protein involved in exopolysaccharide biosynthesis